MPKFEPGRWVLELIGRQIDSCLKDGDMGLWADVIEEKKLVLWSYLPQHGAFQAMASAPRRPPVGLDPFREVITTDTGHLSFALRVGRTVYLPSLVSSPRSRRLLYDHMLGIHVTGPVFVTPFVSEKSGSGFVTYLSFPKVGSGDSQAAITKIVQQLERIRILVSGGIGRFFPADPPDHSNFGRIHQDVDPIDRLTKVVNRIAEASDVCRIGGCGAFVVQDGNVYRTQTAFNQKFVVSRWVRLIRRGAIFERLKDGIGLTVNPSLSRYAGTAPSVVTQGPQEDGQGLSGVSIKIAHHIVGIAGKDAVHPTLVQHDRFSTFIRVELLNSDKFVEVFLNINLGNLPDRTAEERKKELVEALQGCDLTPLADGLRSLRLENTAVGMGIYRDVLDHLAHVLRGVNFNEQTWRRRLNKLGQAVGLTEAERWGWGFVGNTDALSALAGAIQRVCGISVALWRPGPKWLLARFAEADSYTDAIWSRSEPGKSFGLAAKIPRGMVRKTAVDHGVWLFRRRRELAPLLGFLAQIIDRKPEQTLHILRVHQSDFGPSAVEPNKRHVQWSLSDPDTGATHCLWVGTTTSSDPAFFTHLCCAVRNGGVDLALWSTRSQHGNDPTPDEFRRLFAGVPESEQCAESQASPSEGSEWHPAVVARCVGSDGAFEVHGVVYRKGFGSYLAAASMTEYDLKNQRYHGGVHLLPLAPFSLNLKDIRSEGGLSRDLAGFLQTSANPWHTTLPRDRSPTDSTSRVRDFAPLWQEVLQGLSHPSPPDQPREFGKIPRTTPLCGTHLLADNLRLVPVWREKDFLGTLLIYSGQPSSFGSIQATTRAEDIFADNSPESRILSEVCEIAGVTMRPPVGPSGATAMAVVYPKIERPVLLPAATERTVPVLAPALFTPDLQTPMDSSFPDWAGLPWDMARGGSVSTLEVTSGFCLPQQNGHVRSWTTLSICRHWVGANLVRGVPDTEFSRKVGDLVHTVIRDSVGDPPVAMTGGPAVGSPSCVHRCHCPSDSFRTGPCVALPGWFIGTCALCLVRLKLASLVTWAVERLRSHARTDSLKLALFSKRDGDEHTKPHFFPGDPEVVLTRTELDHVVARLTSHVTPIPPEVADRFDPEKMALYVLARDVEHEIARQFPRGVVGLKLREKVQRFLVGKTTRSLLQSSYLTERPTHLRDIRFMDLNWPRDSATRPRANPLM